MQVTRSALHGPRSSDIMSQLRVNAYLMRLDPGLFCVVVSPTPGADESSGLPGVRLSLPPGPGGRPDAVTISGFRIGGWLTGQGDAALVRVVGGPAQIMVTIYQAEDGPDGYAPNLQVTRLLESRTVLREEPPAPMLGLVTPSAEAPARTQPAAMEVLAHVQGVGDVGAMLTDWLGDRGSRRWIEGFAVAPAEPVGARGIEYQAVLGPGWLSPWMEGGQFCGSRAMALPVLGLRVRLRGQAAIDHRVGYTATFVDGSQVGPVFDGEPCEVDGLAPLESFRLEIEPRTPAVAHMEVTGVTSLVKARKARSRSAG